jgi:hypothetical protein
MKLWRVTGVVVAYAAATLVMTQALINLRALGTTSFAGDARLIIWTLAWDNHAVLDRLPLFDANMFFPVASSLNYTEHHFGISLFTLPIYALTHNPTLAYNIVWLLTWIANGLAMHALAFRYTRRHVPAMAAGLIFAFSYYNMLQSHGHLQMIWTWPIPLSLLLLERWFDRPTWKRAAAWGAVVLLEVLSAWYLAVMIVIANTIVGGWRAWDRRSTWSRRSWLTLVAAAGAIALGTAPFAAHYLGLPHSTLDDARKFAADWASYLVPPEQTALGAWWLEHIGRQPKTIFGESALFLGWIALAAGIGGVLMARRADRWHALGPFVALGVAGTVLSFGPDGVTGWRIPGFFDLVWHLPLVSGMRAVARFGLLAVVGLSIAAAIGVEALVRLRPRLAPWVLIVAAPLMLGEWFVVRFPTGPPRTLVTPAIYSHPLVARARAIVSVPSFHPDQWWRIPDYLVYSTTHWRPIVNGYGRTDPDEYFHVISHVNAFPGPNNAKTMRELGVELIVLHAADYPNADEIVREARAVPDYEFVAQIGTDYLIRVK